MIKNFTVFATECLVAFAGLLMAAPFFLLLAAPFTTGL